LLVLQLKGDSVMKWSVGLKIASMNVLAILILILISLASYISINNLLNNTNWRQHSYIVLNHISNILVLLDNAETGERGYLLTNKDNFLQIYQDAVTNIPAELKITKSLIADNINQQHRIELLEQLIANKLLNIQQSINNKEDAQKLPILIDGKKIMDNIRAVTQDMNNEEEALIIKRTEVTKANVEVTFNIILLGTLFGTLFLSFLGFILMRNIAIPLKNMAIAVSKITSGELDNSYQAINRNDEIGMLSKLFAQMVLSLQELAKMATRISAGDLDITVSPKSDKDILGNALAQMVKNLRQLTIDNHEGVKVLNSSVNGIYTLISQLVSAGSETAASVIETTTTIEEVKQTSQVLSQKAKTVADSAQLATQISIGGQKATQETNEGMTRIRDQMVVIAESMMRLSEQTQSISSIIESVDDLAQQSNLLAVNASIEAEKAGEQGRGFRIVAQEIKSLSDQSKQATHRVREILADVQKATSTAVLATEQGNKVAEIGVIKSEESRESIVTLSNSVSEAAQAAIHIAASSQQQLIGMQQAAIAMENIKVASTQNVVGAKQLEIEAHNLKELGLKLQGLIKKYHVTTDA